MGGCHELASIVTPPSLLMIKYLSISTKLLAAQVGLGNSNMAVDCATILELSTIRIFVLPKGVVTRCCAGMHIVVQLLDLISTWVFLWVVG